MSARQSLIVTGSLELQLDTLAERVATRVVELLETGRPPADIRQPLAGSPIYERPAEQVGRTRTADSDPGGFPVGRDHPHSPDNLEETLS